MYDAGKYTHLGRVRGSGRYLLCWANNSNQRDASLSASWFWRNIFLTRGETLAWGHYFSLSLTHLLSPIKLYHKRAVLNVCSWFLVSYFYIIHELQLLLVKRTMIKSVFPSASDCFASCFVRCVCVSFTAFARCVREERKRRKRLGDQLACIILHHLTTRSAAGKKSPLPSPPLFISLSPSWIKVDGTQDEFAHSFWTLSFYKGRSFLTFSWIPLMLFGECVTDRVIMIISFCDILCSTDRNLCFRKREKG